MDNLLYDVDVDENGPFKIPMENKPVFCPQEPSFMAGAFNDEETEERVKSQAARLSKEIDGNPNNLATNNLSCYLHGTIENLCQYDIPVLIDGTIPKIKYGNIVECLVYDKQDIVHDCFLVVGKRVLFKGDSNLYCLIVLKEEFSMFKDKQYPTAEADFTFLHTDEEE